MSFAIPRPTTRTTIVASLAGLGSTVGLFSALWLVGSLGLSTAAASQIVAAILAGGWALRVVIMIFGAGLIGAIAATIVWIVSTRGRDAAIA